MNIKMTYRNWDVYCFKISLGGTEWIYATCPEICAVSMGLNCWDAFEKIRDEIDRAADIAFLSQYDEAHED